MTVLDKQAISLRRSFQSDMRTCNGELQTNLAIAVAVYCENRSLL